MNILLDTNIIIPLEDTSRILDSSFAELRKLSAEQQHCLYIHPIQFEDIKRDKNLERQKNCFVKIEAVFSNRQSTHINRKRLFKAKIISV